MTVPGCSGRKLFSTRIGNVLLDRGRHGRRVQHLGAEESELGRLGEGELRDEARPLDDARIGSHHAVDVRPDLDLVGTQGRPEDRRREIAPAAAEGRDVALLVLADVPGHHRHPRDLAERGADALLGLGQRASGAEAPIGQDPCLPGVDRSSGQPGAREVRSYQPRREPLAVTRERVHRAGRAFAQEGHAVHEAAELGEHPVEECQVEPEPRQRFMVSAGERLVLRLPCLTAARELGQTKEPVRHAADGGDDDDRPALECCANDRGQPPYRLGTSDGGAAELLHDHEWFAPPEGVEVERGANACRVR